MDLERLRELFDLMIEKDIAEIEHEAGGVRVRASRLSRAAAQPAAMVAVAAAAPVTSPAAEAGPPSEAGGDLVDVTSPFVGSFYRSPSPDTPSFVEVGSVVRTGQTLCIIEAMKLMNEIEAECAGTIVEIFAQNGKSVEYGQKLFRIKKA